MPDRPNVPGNLSACLALFLIMSAGKVGGMQAAEARVEHLAQSPRYSLRTTGVARDQASREVLYREFYYCDAQWLQCRVDYRTKDGEIIAKKTLDYRVDRHRPRVLLTDFRQGNEVTIDKESLKHLAGDDIEAVVVDAGFDNFIRSHWTALEAGNPFEFRFLAAGSDDLVNLLIKRDYGPDCEDNTLCLRITLNVWLLGNLVDPIELEYSRESKRLLRFVGVSNIASPSGDSLHVDIEYRYGPEAVTPSADELSPPLSNSRDNSAGEAKTQ